jgi:hypothetical protein
MDETKMNLDDDYVYTYDIEEIDEFVDKLNKGIVPTVVDEQMMEDVKHRTAELQRMILEDDDDDDMSGMFTESTRAKAIQRKIEQNKRKATTEDIMVIKLSDEQKQKIHEEMSTCIVRANHRLKYHKSDEELFDSAERKEIYHRLSSLQKQYYNVNDWREAMKVILDAIDYSVKHDYPWLSQEQAIEAWNKGDIKFTYCPIPQLWTSWTTMITDPETLKGILSGNITVETSADKVSKAKERRHRTEREGVDYDYNVMSDAAFTNMQHYHMNGYDTPISPVIKAMRGTFSRFAIPESNYFFSSTKNEESISPATREKLMSFDWSREGAGKEYFNLLYGNKETFDDIIDLVAANNDNKLYPSFRADLHEFINSIGKPHQEQQPDQSIYGALPSDMESVTKREVELEKSIMDQMMIVG